MQNDIHIAVVDDLPEDREHLQAALTHYAAKHGLRWNISCFSSGEDLLHRYTPGSFPLVFLDILMGGIDGIQTARQLRAADPDVLLVFVTTEAGYAVEGYEMDASGFLVKDDVQKEKRFARLMERLAPRLHIDAVLELTENGVPIQVSAGEILYAEVLDHSMVLHTSGGVHTLRMTMEELKPLLPKDGRFFECHRGVVINLDAVSVLQDKVVTMENGDTLPVSRRRKTELEQNYAAWNIARIRRGW